MAGYLAPVPRLGTAFVDGSGTPYPLSMYYTYIAGTSSPASTWSDASLETLNTWPVVADAAGLFGPIYFSPETGYKALLVEDGSTPASPIWSQDHILDGGAYFAANFGTAMAVGSRNVTDGYEQLATDRLITVDSSGGATEIVLLAAADCTMDLTIKNMDDGAVTLTPNGLDTIDTNSTWVLEAAADPNFPAVTLRPVTGGWLIVSSHRAA